MAISRSRKPGNRLPVKRTPSPWIAYGRKLLVLAAFFVYFAAFFVCPLPSLPAPEGNTWRRFHLLLWLLFPEEWLSLWFGQPAQFSVLDRLAPVAIAGVIWLWAFAWGAGILHLLGLSRTLYPAERFIFSLAMGLNLLSTFFLLCGLFGWLDYRVLFRILAGVSILAGAIFFHSFPFRNDLGTLLARLVRKPSLTIAVAKVNQSIRSDAISAQRDPQRNSPPPLATKLGIGLAVAIILLGAVLPPIEFDVREYHLQAPKEFFQIGRITFLPHNVYANMPLGAEMISLAAMVLTGDWWWGALAGKLAQAGFTLLLAAAIVTCFSRFGGQAPGWVAGWIFLSTPWVIQISILGLVEWAWACYGFLAWYGLAFWLTTRTADQSLPATGAGSSENPRKAAALVFVAGYFAGAATACKYPAVVFIALPLFATVLLVALAGAQIWPFTRILVFLIPDASGGLLKHPPQAAEGAQKGSSNNTLSAISGLRWRWARSDQGFPRWSAATAAGAVTLCLMGMLLGGGAWYIKNAYLTGNPVYPLLGEYLGGKTRDPELIARWNNAHRPPGFSLSTLAGDFSRLALSSEWLSALIWPFIITGWTRIPPPLRRATIFYGLWWIGIWWMATHRIDRFWLPFLPYLCVLAGFGLGEKTDPLRRFKYFLLVIVGFWQLFISSTVGAGYPRFFVPLEILRNDPLRIGPWTIRLNHEQAVKRILLVGEAAVFDYEVPILYNTCFDPTWVEILGKNRSPSEVVQALQHLGVSHILVHWGEIARYRSPGNYGFSSFVTPELFQAWEEAGIIERLPELPGHPAVVVYRVRLSGE